VTPDAAAAFLARVHVRAAAVPRTILFPEATDPRVLEAVRQLARRGSVRPVLVGAGSIPAGPPGIPVLDVRTDPRAAQVVELLLQRRRARGLTREQAATLVGDPLVFADGLVALGEADGCVAGAVHSTAEVLRAALWTIGPAPGVQTVSSAFYLVVPAFRGDSAEVLTFTDCAVVPEPTARQLADIARAAAADRVRIVGDIPRVALLSYSSMGSADGPSVQRVREALAILRAEAPGLSVSGELQADAALLPEVAQRKVPGDASAGHANVLVFPSLDAGNIAYKLVQRLAHASAIGPILQGLARPCSDLSRGATAEEIVHVAAITALQAGEDAPAGAAGA
jgi:phosphate acetyltransferase